MKSFNYLYILLALAFFSCKNHNIEPSLSSDSADNIGRTSGTDCTQHFYYYQNKKKDLGTVSTSSIIIGFAPGLEATEKEKFLATHSTYIKRKETYDTFETTTPEIIDLQPGLSCAQVQELLGVLAQSNLVVYANPTFINADGFRGIGGNFLVTLKGNSTYAQLEELALKTNTRIVEELSAEQKIYILEADKNSQGNALEMGNFFHKQSFVLNAEPDFILQQSPIGIW